MELHVNAKHNINTYWCRLTCKILYDERSGEVVGIGVDPAVVGEGAAVVGVTVLEPVTCRRCRLFSRDITDISSDENEAPISYKSSVSRQTEKSCTRCR